MCRRLEAEDAVAVKSIDPTADGWLDTEDHPVLAAARRDRLAAALAGFEMGVPFNVLNRAFDVGFKPLPWGDEGYVPTAVKPVGRGGETGRRSEAMARQGSEGRGEKLKVPVAFPPDPFTRLAAALTTNGSQR